MAALLNNLQAGDILFVDEIHRLNRQVEEILYPAMEDYAIDIILGKGKGKHRYIPGPDSGRGTVFGTDRAFHQQGTGNTADTEPL